MPEYADPPPLVLPIAAGQVGKPLLAVLRAQVPPAVLKPVLAHGGVWLNGSRVADMQQAVPAAGELVLHRPPGNVYSQPQIHASHICYEDDALLALHKQAGWYTTPTPWDAYGNIRTVLQTWLAEREGGQAYVHLLHQLDRDTSGVLLCSRDAAINPLMQQLFDQGHVIKEYLCLCSGQPLRDSFTVHTGHGRGRAGRWRLYDLAEVGRVLPNGSRVKVAMTSFAILQRGTNASLLRATLHTGRTHQIRLHLAHCGHPLVGDVRYGGPAMLAGQAVAAHRLHAWRLSLPHPLRATPLVITAAVPTWVSEFGAQKSEP